MRRGILLLCIDETFDNYLVLIVQCSTVQVERTMPLLVKVQVQLMTPGTVLSCTVVFYCTVYCILQLQYLLYCW